MDGDEMCHAIRKLFGAPVGTYEPVFPISSEFFFHNLPSSSAKAEANFIR